MKIDISKLEIGIFLLLGVYFLFAATNVNQTLGTIYAIFCVLTIIFIVIDPSRDLKLRRESDSPLASISIGAIAYVALLVLGTFVVSLIPKVIDLLGATTPALATSPFFNFLTFAVAVPIAETAFFFVVLYDVAASLIGVRIDKSNLTNWKLWGLIVLIALGFMFFHLTSKGINNIPILVLVFFMAIISMLLVTWFKSGEQAIWMHVIANTIPSLSLLGFNIALIILGVVH